MKALIKYLCAGFVFLISNLAHAAAPFIDYQWAMSPDACLERASDSMQRSGFRITSNQGIEVVGVQGNYKAVIACVGEGADTAVFIVSGSSYKQANQHALRLKANFLN